MLKRRGCFYFSLVFGEAGSDCPLPFCFSQHAIYNSSQYSNIVYCFFSDRSICIFINFAFLKDNINI